MKFKSFVLSVLLLVLFGHSKGQNYNILKFGVREGVLHSLVTGITQDQRGEIWMSTGGGLCRFNGFEFQYYTTKDGLNFTRLTCVATDEDDNIWVGSSKGLNFFNGKTISSVNEWLSKSDVLSISSAGRSKVWVITSSGLYKVTHISNDFRVDSIYIPKFQASEQSQIFQDRIISSFIYQTSSGGAFYGNNGNLFKINNLTAQQIELPIGVLVNTCFEFDGELYFGTNKGLFIFNGLNLNPHLSPILSQFDIKNICGYENQLWFLAKETDNHSYILTLDIKKSSLIQKIGKNNGLSDEPTQIFIDHEGNLWSASNNGINLLRGNAFTSYTTTNGLIGNKIWGIAKDSNGNLWVGTIGEGLTVIKNNRFYTYNTSNGLPDNYVGKIYEDKKGNVYVGTSNAGLNMATYNKKTDSFSFKRLPLLTNNKLRIDDIVEDKQGMLWVGTNKGLYYTRNLVDFNKFNLSTTDTGQVFVQKILIDSIRNIMWVGTRNHGVYSIQNHLTKPFEKLNPNEEVSSLTQDSQGNIWFGTRNNGLFRFDGTDVIRISENDGLASNLIYILHNDRMNNLWIGTNLGLDKLDLKSIAENNRIVVRHYGSDEGLLDIETNLNGVLEAENGSFWIATNGGLLRYEPNFDKLNGIAPKVRIVKMKLNSLETDWSKFSDITNLWNGLPKKLTLKHYQNHLTFEFVGISFRNSKQVRYVWKLDGFDDKWIESTNRQAIYSNIPPGQYTFRLKAANSDGVWSAEVHSMPVTIRPPFWATWWFKLTMIALVSLSIYLYVLYRVKSLRDKQKELEAIVNIRTLELREQFEIVDQKNKQILDSLSYAKFLQNAILSPVDEFKSYFSDAFILYRPKDYVSGDFYWLRRKDNISVFAVADCTGHGVPGAIISVICENALRQAAADCDYSNPALMLEKTNQHVLNAFTQSYKEIHHGMEIALCTFNHSTYELQFSGANLGIHIMQNQQLTKQKPCIQRIGWNYRTIPFTNHTIKLEKGNQIFLFTDGYIDQFEPKNKKKFSSARLRKLLLNSSHLPLSEIHTLLESEFEKWKGDYDQIDDVLIVGLTV